MNAHTLKLENNRLGIQLSSQPVFCKHSPCRGISSPPLFFSPPLTFTLAPSVLCPHSSLVWRCIDNTPLFFPPFFIFLRSAGLYHQSFNVTPRQPLASMEPPHKLRWDKFLILATALMSPAFTWVHLGVHVRAGFWSWATAGGSHCLWAVLKTFFIVWSKD